MSTASDSVPSTPAPRSRFSTFAFPALVIFLVLGGLGLVVRSSTAGGVYDLTLTELLAKRADHVGQDVRVGGNIQAGSFRDASGSGGVHLVFNIADASGNSLEVHYRQLLPDAFEEGREVIVQGQMQEDGSIECGRLTVKCPSKYQDENQTGQAGQYYGPKHDGQPGYQDTGAKPGDTRAPATAAPKGL